MVTVQAISLFVSLEKKVGDLKIHSVTFGSISSCRVLMFLSNNPYMFIFVMLIENYTKNRVDSDGERGKRRRQWSRSNTKR